MTRKEARRQTRQLDVLASLGIGQADAETLRRISMTLHRWHEMECGTERGAIERAEPDGDKLGRPYWHNAVNGRQYPVADRETGALRRLSAIMAKHPTLSTYVQGDPRGCALYILRPGDVPEGQDAESYYSRGIAVY